MENSIDSDLARALFIALLPKRIHREDRLGHSATCPGRDPGFHSDPDRVGEGQGGHAKPRDPVLRGGQAPEGEVMAARSPPLAGRLGSPGTAAARNVAPPSAQRTVRPKHSPGPSGVLSTPRGHADAPGLPLGHGFWNLLLNCEALVLLHVLCVFRDARPAGVDAASPVSPTATASPGLRTSCHLRRGGACTTLSLSSLLPPLTCTLP